MLLCGAAVAIAACADESPAPPPTDNSPVVRAVPVCTAADEAPLPDGRGATRCLHVGADITPAGRPSPDTAGLPRPVVHVVPGATRGDGSEALPLGEIVDALPMLANGGTLALHRGEHPVPRTLTLPSGVTVVGVGPTDGTTLRITSARACFELLTRATVTVRDLAIRVDDGATVSNVLGFEVPADASLTIDNVRVTGVRSGIRASGSVTATRLSVLNASQDGIDLFAPAVGRFRGLLVRDGLAVALRVDTSEVAGAAPGAARVHLTEAALVHNARGGVVMVGNTTDGSGADACSDDGPGAGTGALDCLTRVSVQDNGRVGLVVEGNRRVELRAGSFSGTRVVAGAPDGDGVQVRGGASLAFDPSIRTEAARGTGSFVVGNGRVGVFAQGVGASLSLRGAQVNSNAAPGAFVAAGARAELVGFCELRGNGALGLGVTRTASIAAVQGNGIGETRVARLTTSTGMVADFGDGLCLDQSARVDISRNVVSSNPRFGVVFLRVSGSFTGNGGSGNLYGQGVYDSQGLAGATVPQIGGSAPPPREATALAADLAM